MDSIWRNLIDIAKWAPSIHNMQPWKFKILDEKYCEIYYDPKRILVHADPGSKFSLLTFGIIAETISIAAANKGYRLEAKTHSDKVSFEGEKPVLFATFNLTEDKTITEKFTIEDIIMRKTNRSIYMGGKIPANQIDELKNLARDFDNDFEVSEKKEDILFLQKLNQKALFYDLSQENIRNEIAGWLRYSASEAEQKKDGLWSKCFYFPGWLMKLFFSHQSLVFLPIVKKIIERYYIRSTAGASSIGWLLARFETADELIKNGRMIMRFWLQLHRFGIATHPYGSLVTNPTANREVKEYFYITENEKILWLIFRMGYAAEPPRSYRLETEDYFIT